MLRPVWWKNPNNMRGAATRGIYPLPENGIGYTRIFAAVCKYYGIDRNELYKSQRGFFNEPKNVSIYLMRQLRRDRLKQIGEQFQIEKYSSVSSVIERMKQKLKRDRKLKERINEITDMALMSYEQI